MGINKKINNGLAEVCEDLAKYEKSTPIQKKKFLQYAKVFRCFNNKPNKNKSKKEVKEMGRKLTPEEKRVKRVNKALESIRKLEKYYEQDVLKSACNRYSKLLRDKKNALREKRELEERLEKLKGRI